jgi:hypothetical protein
MSYFQKSPLILKLWIVQISLRIDALSIEQIDDFFRLLSTTEADLTVDYEKVNDWEKAIYYQEQSILHAKQLKEGKKKIKIVYDSLDRLASIYHYMSKWTEAKAAREEAYEYVSQSHDPEHPLVLEA